MMGIRARAEGAVEPLLAAAEAHLAVGVFGHAAELAESAAVRATRSRSLNAQSPLRLAGRLAAQARAKLGHEKPPSALSAGLTRREAEIARLAAQGLRDKDIAEALTLSVRTIESHLATTYRKLNIASRRELDGALNGTNPAR